MEEKKEDYKSTFVKVDEPLNFVFKNSQGEICDLTTEEGYLKLTSANDLMDEEERKKVEDFGKSLDENPNPNCYDGRQIFIKNPRFSEDGKSITIKAYRANYSLLKYYRDGKTPELAEKHQFFETGSFLTIRSKDDQVLLLKRRAGDERFSSVQGYCKHGEHTKVSDNIREKIDGGENYKFNALESTAILEFCEELLGDKELNPRVNFTSPEFKGFAIRESKKEGLPHSVDFVYEVCVNMEMDKFVEEIVLKCTARDRKEHFGTHNDEYSILDHLVLDKEKQQKLSQAIKYIEENSDGKSVDLAKVVVEFTTRSRDKDICPNPVAIVEIPKPFTNKQDNTPSK